MNTDLTHRFGITPGYVAMQCVSLLLLCLIIFLNVRITRSVLKSERGAAVPIWILAIWLLPLVGAICAASFVKNEALEKDAKLS